MVKPEHEDVMGEEKWGVSGLGTAAVSEAWR